MPLSVTFRIVVACTLVTLFGCSEFAHSAAVPSAPQSGSRPIPPRREPGKVIYSFAGSPDGENPQSSVRILFAPTTLLGTTLKGGDSNNDGTVYTLTARGKGQWAEKVVYTFQGYPTDGSEPASSCCTGTAKPAFTTGAGGTSNNGTFVVFNASASGPWKESFVYSFAGEPDGAKPSGSIVWDEREASFFGTTLSGGMVGSGTVFRVRQNGSTWKEDVVYSFRGGSDAASPYGGVTADKAGNLYGSSFAGGTQGLGTVYSLTRKGRGYTERVLHSFLGPPYDGEFPYGCVTEDQKGDLYGTTREGGTYELGTVFELMPESSTYVERILWNFGSVSADGEYPVGGVLLDRYSILGDTSWGGYGSSASGTYFTLTPSGSAYSEAVYTFTGANGAKPASYSSPSKSGKTIFITTSGGGADSDGAVFNIISPSDSKVKAQQC